MPRRNVIALTASSTINAGYYRERNPIRVADSLGENNLYGFPEPRLLSADYALMPAPADQQQAHLRNRKE